MIKECGAKVHLAHPLGNDWGNRRVKNDERDATHLVDLLRMGRLAEAWIAPPPLRELREQIRYRAKLVHLRTNLKSQVHSVLAKEGVAVPMTDLFRVGGQGLLDKVHLAEAYRVRVNSRRELIHPVNREIAMLEEAGRPCTSPATSATTPSRPFPAWARCWPRSLWPRSATSRVHLGLKPVSWAGLTPTHKESDVKVHRGHITKQGSRLVRWAAVEAVARQRTDTPIRRHHRNVGDRRGTKIGRVAAARKLLILVDYGLRDGEIRCLAETGETGTDATRCELAVCQGPRSAAKPRSDSAHRVAAGPLHVARRDERCRHPDPRVASQHRLALEIDRNVSPTGDTGDAHKALTGFESQDVNDN